MSRAESHVLTSISCVAIVDQWLRGSFDLFYLSIRKIFSGHTIISFKQTVGKLSSIPSRKLYAISAATTNNFFT